MRRFVAVFACAWMLAACGESAEPTAPPSGAPSIAAPAELVAGSDVVLTGAGFGATPGSNTVTVDGVPATVVSASPERLVFRLGVHPCQRARDVDVVVTSPGGTATARSVLRVASERTPQLGELLFVLDSAAMSCLDLALAPGKHFVSVYSASTSPQAMTDFRVQGNATVVPVGAAGAAVADAAVRSSGVGRADADVASEANTAEVRAGSGVAIAARSARAAARSGDARMLELDRAMLAREPWLRGTIGRRARAPGGAGAVEAAVAPPVPLTPGAIATLRVRDAQSCATFTSINARVVAVTQRAVVVEDVASPLAGQMDQHYQDIAAEFDAVTFPMLLEHFGNPLALDAETDGNGRVVMLFTPIINQRDANLLGFVSVCDFFPPSSVPASNQAEIFYARVPTALTGTGSGSVTAWKRQMRATVAHETKHIVMYAERLSRNRNAPLEESWLEEGTAQVAEELFGRVFWGTVWKGNATYRQTLYCDVRADPARWPECARNAYAIVDQFFFLHQYAKSHETLSVLSPGSSDATIYGSAWWFVRWATDNHAATEQAFLKALTQEPSLTGVANVTARTGRPWQELLGTWLFTFVADDRPGLQPPAGARYTVPTWNLPDMFRGLSIDFSGVDAEPFRIRVVPQGTFLESATVVGGAGVMLELTGGDGVRQLVSVRSGTGGPLPGGSPLRLAILRVP